MFIKWHVYPSLGFITDEQFNQLPSPPFERFGQYITYQSPVWDVDTQTYVEEYITQLIGYRVPFEKVFNCHCKHDIEVHGAGSCTFSNTWLREFINCGGSIVLDRKSVV